MSVIGEALLGGAIGVLLQSILNAKEKATFFKLTLQHLESTLHSVRPIMVKVIKSKHAPSDVSTQFVQQLKKAKVLVDMYSDIRMWKFLEKRKVRKLIQELDASLQKLLSQDLQVEQTAYLTVINQDVAEMNAKMDRVIALLEGTKANGFEPPEPVTEEALPSPKRESDGDKPSSPRFELLLKMKRSKFGIGLWRRNGDK